MATFIKARDDWANAFKDLGSGFTEGYMKRADENALQKAIHELPPDATPRQIIDTVASVKTYHPESKRDLADQYIKSSQYESDREDKREARQISRERNEIARSKQVGQNEESKLRENFQAQGYDEVDSQALASPHVPNSVKQGISKRHEDEVARGIKNVAPQNAQNPAQEQSNQQEAQQAPDQMAEVAAGTETPLKIEEASAPILQAAETALKKETTPEKPAKQKEWPKVEPPPESTAKERNAWRQKNQSFNNKELKEAKGKSNTLQKEKISLGRLSDINDSGKLPEGLSRIIIDPATGDIRPLAALTGIANKETQAFVKTVNDFLSGAQKYFGGKVSNFEVGTFKSRLPTLLNTEDGRRLIIEQMKLLNDLEGVHITTLEDGLKHYGYNASYSDIQRIVDDKVIFKEEEIIQKINNIDQATRLMDVMAHEPKYKDTKLFQDPETGKFKAFRKEDIPKVKKRGWIEW